MDSDSPLLPSLCGNTLGLTTNTLPRQTHRSPDPAAIFISFLSYYDENHHVDLVSKTITAAALSNPRTIHNTGKDFPFGGELG